MSNLQPPPPTSSRPTSTTPLLSSSSKSQERASPATKMFLPLTDPRTRDYIIGIILLLGVVLMWVISSFITSDLFDRGWKKPFWVTYINTSSFAFYLLPFLYRRSFASPSPSNTTSSQYSALPPSSPPSSASYRRTSSAHRVDERSVSPMATLHPPLTSSAMRVSKEDGPIEKLSERETASLAALFCGFWFAANWSVNKSLEWTSVGSSTILASMSGFFTLGIGRIFGVETFTKSKLIAVSISFFGVLLVSLADSLGITASLPPSPPLPDIPSSSSFHLFDIPVHLPPPHLRFWGDSLALLSAFCYALYVILLKIKIGEESRIDMQLFFGFVGLWNVVLLWPIGLGLHWAGWETIELPTGRAAWTTVLVNMAITLTSDYIYVIAMLKTTPLVVTIGLSLTIPFAVLGDLFRGTSSGGWQALSGAGLVLASFCFMGVEGATELEDEIEHDHVALLVEEESEGEGEDEEEERLRSGSEGHRGRRGRTNDGGLGVV